LEKAGQPAASRTLILIENKIDAEFQELQAHRYKARADDFVKNECCGKCVCVLIAPGEYVESSEQADVFDAVVTYENLIAFFERVPEGSTPELEARRNHRREVLEQALNRYRRGWVLRRNEAVTRTWQFYYQRAVNQAPGLEMRKTGPKPSDSNWIILRAGSTIGSVPHCEIVHKLHDGSVELHIRSWGRWRHLAEPLLQPMLGSDMEVRTAKKSLSVKLTVPSVNAHEPPEPQVIAIDAGLNAALRIKDWYHRNRSALQECAKAIASASAADTTRV
jgi:hypothetical protein